MSTSTSKLSESPSGSLVPRRGPAVLAPRPTRVAASVVVVGVLLQAGVAGGFLAGHVFLTDIHMFVGVPLLVSSLVLVGIGLFGRRARREAGGVLITRIGVFAALVTTAVIGILAAGGVRDLLVIHIPMAIITMALAARLAGAAKRSG